MSMEEMLMKIQSLMFFGGQWHARARGDFKFFKAYTAREAVMLALGIKDDDEL